MATAVDSITNAAPVKITGEDESQFADVVDTPSGKRVKVDAAESEETLINTKFMMVQFAEIIRQLRIINMHLQQISNIDTEDQDIERGF